MAAASQNVLPFREYNPSTRDPDSFLRYAYYILNHRKALLRNYHVRPPQGAYRGSIMIRFYRVRYRHGEQLDGYGFARCTWSETNGAKDIGSNTDHKERTAKRSSGGGHKGKDDASKQAVNQPDIWFSRREALVDIIDLPEIVPGNEGVRAQVANQIMAAGFLTGTWGQVDPAHLPVGYLEPLTQIQQHLYDWPNEEITIIAEPEGQSEPTMEQMFSNFTAVRAMERVLRTQWRMAPVRDTDAINHDILVDWASLVVKWSADGQMCRIDATHEKDWPVRGAFKRDETGLWQSVKASELPEKLDGKEAKYELNYLPRRVGSPTMYIFQEGRGWEEGWHMLVTSPSDELPLEQRPLVQSPSGTKRRRIEQADAEENLGRVLGRGAGQWKFVKQLDWRGEREFNRENVHLYKCVSDTGTLIDRIAVKVVNSDTREEAEEPVPADVLMHDPRHHFQQVPRQGMLTKKDKNNCILPMRGWSQNPGFYQSDIHIYIEYALYGSLSSLLQKFTSANKLVPEPFIWYTARKLIQACQLMEENMMIHPDIKLENIFCMEAHPNRDFPAFCMPVVGDFDLMVPLNYHFTHTVGTYGWLTPEQLNNGHATPALHVYAIGLILWSLMRKRPHGTIYNTTHGSLREGPLPGHEPGDTPPLPADSRRLYSTRLEKFVEDLLVKEVDSRMSLQEVSDAVEEGLQKLEARYPGLKTKRREDGGWPGFWDVMGREADQFRVDRRWKRHRWGEESGGSQRNGFEGLA